jgi:PadR family transcriptional regulator, regulatory protein PadR
LTSFTGKTITVWLWIVNRKIPEFLRGRFVEGLIRSAAPQRRVVKIIKIPILKIGILDYYAAMAKNPKHRDLFPGALEIMILQSLRYQPMHGYALVKHIKQVSEDLLQVEEGSLYPALQRMLKEGWLEAETGTSAKGRPTRIYRLTDAGVRHLEKERVSFERMFAGITRVLAVAKPQEA